MRDDELRALGPPGLSADRHAARRAELMALVGGDVAPDDPGPRTDEGLVASIPGRRRRRGRRRATGLVVVAVGLIATGSAAAAVVNALRPDPQEAATVVENSRPEIPWHDEGWRPELQAELVDCALGASEPETAFSAYAADLPLGDAITGPDFVRACTAKAAELDEHANDARPSLCTVGTAPFPRLTVLLDGSLCADAPGFRTASEDDVATRNRARRAEVSILAFEEECPTYDQADTWVRARLAEADVPLSLATPAAPPTTVAGDEGEGRPCYRGFVRWTESTVVVDTYTLPN